MRKKKMWIGISSILGIFIVICLVIAFSVKANLLNYNDIAFTYGKEGDVVYYKFVSEDGLDINLNSIVTKNMKKQYLQKKNCNQSNSFVNINFIPHHLLTYLIVKVTIFPFLI